MKTPQDVMAAAAALASSGGVATHPTGLAALAQVNWIEDFGVLTSAYVDYWQAIVASTLFWLGIHFLCHLIFNGTPLMATIVSHLRDSDIRKGRTPKTEAKYLYRARFDLYSKITALVHAVVATGFALWAFTNFSPTTDLTIVNAYTSTPMMTFVTQVSAGYFIYDFLIAVYDWDPAFIAHGFSSAVIYAHASFPFCTQMGAIYLIYEISTIFVHIRWLLISTGRGKTKAFTVAQILFAAFFFISRLGFGLIYSTFYLQPFLWNLFVAKPVAPHSHIATALFAISNLLLTGLNIMWSRMIIGAIVGGGKGKGKKAAVKGDAAPAVGAPEAKAVVTTVRSPTKSKKAD